MTVEGAPLEDGGRPATERGPMATRVDEFDPPSFVEARKAKGLSQRAVATQVGISQPQLAELERGKRAPTIELLRRLADVVGATADKFQRKTTKATE